MTPSPESPAYTIPHTCFKSERNRFRPAFVDYQCRTQWLGKSFSRVRPENILHWHPLLIFISFLAHWTRVLGHCSSSHLAARARV